MNKPDDFRALGRQHGEEAAHLCTGFVRSGEPVEQAALWFTHRMVSLADDLRHVGASQDELMTWATAMRDAWNEGMALAAMQSDRGLAFARMPVAGHA